MMALIPCSACGRHVYTSETSCPFCRHELGDVAATASRRAPVARMSRAALVVLGMSSVACGGDTEQSDKTNDDTNTTSNNATTSTPNSDGEAIAVYGGPPIGFTNGTVSTATGVPIYGAPPSGTSSSAGGAPAGGSGNTDSAGAAGEASDVGVGGSPALPTTDSGGGPIYGAPPVPW